MNKSFTLIELLVVIVIIGILAGVIVVSTSSSISKANIAKVKVFENTVQSELGANMVSRWKLDEIISTTTTPDTWGTNTGTLGDGAAPSTYPTLKEEPKCVTGKCMYFDGINDYISILDKSEFNFGSEVSVFAWIKGSNITASQGILGQHNSGTPNQRSWLMYHNPTYEGKLSVEVSSSGATTAKRYYSVSNILNGNWQLVGFVFNKGSLKLYIDGQETEVVKSLDNPIVTLFDTSSNINIGCWFYENNPTGYLKEGLIDDVRIYDAALSTSQIKQEYVVGLNSLLANGNISKEEYDERLNNLALSK